MARRANPFLGLVFTLIFCIVGIVVARMGANVLNNAKESVDWPMTQGKIIHSEVVRNRSSSSSSSSGSSVTYEADVLFEFNLNGAIYSSTNVSFGQYSSSDASHAREIVRKYPEGSSVTVYYNPEDPDVSVLEPGVTTSSHAIFWMGVGFSILGGLGFLGCLGSILMRLIRGF